MRNIVVIGSSGHAKVVVDIIEKENKYRIAGYLDPQRKKGERVLGYPVLGSEVNLPETAREHDVHGGIVAIGDNFVRQKVFSAIRKLDPEFEFITAIHPSANIGKGCKIGAGTVIMPGVCVNSESSIGDNCILNTLSSLDHESVMEDFSSLAPNVSTGGNVFVGKFSAVGIGATVLQGVRIGEHAVIGAGSVVLSHVPDYTLVYGVPAEIIRTRKAGEKYLHNPSEAQIKLKTAN